MPRKRIRTRPSELGAALAAAVVLAGCGSGDERRTAPQPKLPRDVATQLAGRSDRVAAALDEGDSCRAVAEAQTLQQASLRAINERRVPGAFQEHLGATVNHLVSRIECVPPAEDDEHDENNGPGKHNGEKKKDRKGKG